MDYSLSSDFDPWLLKWDEEDDGCTTPNVPDASRPECSQVDSSNDQTNKNSSETKNNAHSTRIPGNGGETKTPPKAAHINASSEPFAPGAQPTMIPRTTDIHCGGQFATSQMRNTSNTLNQSTSVQHPFPGLGIGNGDTHHHEQHTNLVSQGMISNNEMNKTSVSPHSNVQNNNPVENAPSTHPQQPPKSKPQNASEQAKTQQLDPQRYPLQPTPPFFLFDAPCELRTNFLLSQRGQNLPPTQDSNSHHYGMAINGFHPQLNAQFNPLTPLSSTDGIWLNGMAFQQGTNSTKDPILVDGRYKRSQGRGGKQRNEREQKRAQKITELIEDLRQSMLKGGWKVEMKSKYHTLSTCADYVKQLIKSNQEKEAAVQKAKSDLSVRQQKLEEDKAMHESRSDPESVTSSLTASTNGSRGKSENTRHSATASNANRDTQKAANSNGAAEHTVSLSSSGLTNIGEVAVTFENSNKRDNAEAIHDSQKISSSSNKKSITLEMNNQTSCDDDANSSTDSSSEDGNGCGGHGGKNISLDKMSSIVSDMTDSNKSSSDGTTGPIENIPHRTDRATKRRCIQDNSSDTADPSSSSSISSTAAVVSGVDSRGSHNHADIVIKENSIDRTRKRKFRGQTSLDQDFVLDYEEVFLTSNVPQLIATPAGRVVTCNKFFLHSTGLSLEEVACLTIFSIVRVDKLSALFEIVADALENSSSHSVASTSKESSVSSGCHNEKSKVRRDLNYESLTLPCISFPSRYKRPSKDSGGIPIPLHMTVSLMFDKDPRKRCLHCIFTDNPGTKNSIGAVSADLLALVLSKESCRNNSDSITKERNNIHKRNNEKLEKTNDISGDNAKSIEIEMKSSGIRCRTLQ